VFALRAKLVMRGLGFVAIAALFGAFAAPQSAGAQATSLAGQWTATPLTVNWKIGDWGQACGPKPSGGGGPSGTATIEESGGELIISGVGRTHSTRECYEQLPGLSRTGHTAGTRSWRTTCKSSAEDPRQATLVTTVTATDNQITYDETGQYQFVIQGQNCTASVRRTRYFQRPQGKAGADAGTSTPAATATTTADGVTGSVALEKEAKSNACALPGPPARIEVRPSRKLIRPGENFSFRASVVDARGCTLGIAPTFRTVNAAPGVVLSAGGRVDVSDGTAEGEVPIVAVVGSRSVGVVLQVVSRERYDALLAEGGFDATGASAETAVARLESASVGSRATVVEDDSARRRTLFVGVVGGASLLLGLIGFALVRRSRQRALAVPDSRRALRTPEPRPPRPMVCPTCRDEFPPQAQFCPVDGNRLVPFDAGTTLGPSGAVCPVCGQGYDPGVSTCPKHDEPLIPPAIYAAARASARPEIQKICPVCGTQYVGESQFCGQCGAALVQVN
jgi:hypothetical protein